MQEPTNRNSALDGLRGIGALIVVFWHISVVFFPAAAWGTPAGGMGQWVHESPLWIFLSGTFAVSLFFVLSGYVLTESHFRGAPPEFLIKRMVARPIRLGLPAAASTLAWYMLLVIIPDVVSRLQIPVLQATGGLEQVSSFLNLTHDTSLRALLLNLFWLPWFQAPDFSKLYNGVLWTMYVELLGSILTMGIALALTGRSKFAKLAVYVMVSALLIECIPGYGVYFSLMLVGAAFAAFESETSQKNGLVTALLLVLGVLLGSNLFAPYAPVLIYPGVSGRLALMALGAVLIFYAVLRSSVSKKALSHRVPQFLGRISFTLYLSHSLIIVFGCWLYLSLEDVLTRPQNVIVSASGTLALSLVAAACLTRLVDQNALKLSRRFATFVMNGRLAAGLRALDTQRRR